MNKNLKLIIIILIVLAVLGLAFLLVTNSENELVATTSTEEYDEKLEISFKNNTINTVKVTFTSENTESLDSLKTGIYYAIGLAVDPDEIDSAISGLDFEQTDKTLTIELTAKEYSLILGKDLNGSNKKDVEKMLKEDGYTVK